MAQQALRCQLRRLAAAQHHLDEARGQEGEREDTAYLGGWRPIFLSNISETSAGAVRQLIEIAKAVHRSLNPAFLDQTAGLTTRFAEISSPWAKLSDEIASATAFAKVQGFGSMLDHIPAFEPDSLSCCAAASVTGVPPYPAFRRARSSGSLGAYIEQGFDHSLVEAPDPAFL